MAKYKNIGSAIHNWAHSFMSIENYDEHGYFVAELYNAAKMANTENVEINCLTGEISPCSVTNKRVSSFLAQTPNRLFTLLASQNVKDSMIVSLKLTVQYDFSASFAELEGIYFTYPEKAPPAAKYKTKIVAIDNRNKEYSAEVKEWWY
jgi:hypothetical protein